VDEFQSFANDSFANILSEARKYKLNLTIAHQYIEQMGDEVRAAVFGNVGTMITFRVGSYDAEVLEKEFAPTFTAEDIVNLGAYQIYLRLMIDGIGSTPFSAGSMPPLEKPEKDSTDAIRESSRAQFSKPRAEVEVEIRKKMNIGGENDGGGQGGSGGGNSNGGNTGGNSAGNAGGNTGGGNGGRNSNNTGSNSDRGSGKRDNTGGRNGGKKFDSRTRTQKYDSNDLRDQKPKRKNTVIDEETKAELERLLHEDVKKEKKNEKEEKVVESSVNNKNKEAGEDKAKKFIPKKSEEKQEPVSLKDLQKNTQNGGEAFKKNNKGPSKENTNSLKEALGAVLAGGVSGGSGAPNNATDKSTKEKIADKPKDKKNNEQQGGDGRNSAPKINREVPEKELKDVLGLE
jgi:hypothetical protein